MANSLHSFFCELVKQKLGASFVGWEQYKDEYKLKAIVPGMDEPLYFNIKGTPEDVTQNNYMDLLNKINNGRGEV